MRFLSSILCILIVLSSIVCATPVAVGTVTNVSENIEGGILENSNDEQADLTAENSNMYDDTYGHLLYNVDFEKGTAFKDGQLLSAQGLVNGSFDTSEGWYFKIAGQSSATITEENGNSFLRIVVNKGSTNPQLVTHSGSLYTQKMGIFTVMADLRAVKYTNTDAYKFTGAFFQPEYKDASGNSKSVRVGAAIKPAELSSDVFSTAVRTTVKADTSSYKSIVRILHVFGHNTSSPEGGNIFDIDNLKLYFKPFSQDVTILGETNVTVNVKIEDLDSTVTKDELIALAKGAGCIGLRDLTLEDGSSFEKIDVLKVNTVKGVFKTYETYVEDYGTLLYDIDFETGTAYEDKQLLSKQGYVNKNISGNEKWYLNVSGYKSATVTEENGDSFLRVTVNKGATNPQVNTYANGLFTQENGFFTALADIRAVQYTNTDAYKFTSVFFQPAYKDAAGNSKSFNISGYVKPEALSGTVFTKVSGVSKRADTQSYKSITNILHVFGHNASSPEGGNVFDIDNIKLYYKPFTTTVTIAGNESLSIPEKTFEVQLDNANYVITKDALMKSITTDDDVVLRDLTLSDGTSFDSVDLDKVTSFKAVYTKVDWTHDTYGTLLYNIDFETTENALGMVNNAWPTQVMTEQGYVNPDIEGSENWYIQPGAINSIEKIYTENNNYLKITNKTSSFPQLKTHAGTVNATFNKTGYYTIVADVMTDISGNAGATFNFFGSRYYYRYIDEKGTAKDDANVDSVAADRIVHKDNGGSWENGSWETFVTTRGDKGNSTVDYIGPKQLLHIFWYKANPTTADADGLYIDNVKLYYKPFSANVTILGGENKDYADKTITVEIGTDLDSTITKQELMALAENNTDMILADLTLSDGTSFEEIDVVDVSEVKAVWLSKAPTSHNVASIRTSDPSGIRFLASVETLQKDLADEYGFMVTLVSHLGDIAPTDLEIDTDVKKVMGVSYGFDPKSEKNVDRIYEIDGDTVFFTAALHGMPNTEEAYREEIIVRPYLRTKDGMYYYAEPMIRSVLDVAKAIRDNDYKQVDEYGKQYVKDILTVCKESV